MVEACRCLGRPRGVNPSAWHRTFSIAGNIALRVSHPHSGSLMLIAEAWRRFRCFCPRERASRFGRAAGAMPSRTPQHARVSELLPPHRLPFCGRGVTLSAMGGDRMIGGRTAQRGALAAGRRISFPLFGGLPATGAIARTATHVAWRSHDRGGIVQRGSCLLSRFGLDCLALVARRRSRLCLSSPQDHDRAAELVTG